MSTADTEDANNMKSFVFAAIFLASGAYAADKGVSQSCMVKECPAGTKAITYATKGDRYFACPSEDLAAYTNTVLGIISMQAQFGVRANISPATGEPEQEGETKVLLDMLRTRAKVKTFDQAAAQCTQGKAGVGVVVENNQKNSSMVWVSTQKGSQMFWLPKAHLDVAPVSK